MFFFKKWTNPASFLFILALFIHKSYRRNVGLSGIRTRIVGVEGELADHLTTTTARHRTCYFQSNFFKMSPNIVTTLVNKIVAKNFKKLHNLVAVVLAYPCRFTLIYLLRKGPGPGPVKGNTQCFYIILVFIGR